ncbi:MAG: hypothetical protein V3R67_03450 [Thermodesulfobacteriota bacterium]
MKKIFLTCLMFVLICPTYADFAKSSEVQAKDIKATYTQKAFCGEGCISIPDDYQNEYHKIVSNKVVVDEAMKAAYDLAEAAKKVKKNASDALKKNISFGKTLYLSVQLTNDSKGISMAQKDQLRIDVKPIKDKLFDGRICDAREDISNLVSTGIITELACFFVDCLITQADIDTFLASIDTYKNCSS